MDERAVIKRCQNGDKAAFDELIRFFYPYVSKYLLKVTGSADITEDLTRETFVKMIRAIDTHSINGKASFATYIITIAKNCYMDYCRSHKRLELMRPMLAQFPRSRFFGICKAASLAAPCKNDCTKIFRRIGSASSKRANSLSPKKTVMLHFAL